MSIWTALVSPISRTTGFVWSRLTDDRKRRKKLIQQPYSELMRSATQIQDLVTVFVDESGHPLDGDWEYRVGRLQAARNDLRGIGSPEVKQLAEDYANALNDYQYAVFAYYSGVRQDPTGDQRQALYGQVVLAAKSTEAVLNQLDDRVTKER